MKIGLICYHRNIANIYPLEWIEQCKSSILNQTYKDFDIFECEYSGKSDYKVFENSDFESKEFINFVHAMNYLLDKAFNNGYDYVLNVNLDDHYDLKRIEKQVEYAAKGFDIISSNFSLVRNDNIVLTHEFDKLNIKEHLEKNHNILCHPVIMYSKHFWEGNRYIPEQLPYEDLLLWKRAINNGYRFVILPDVLCYHRVHENSVCNSNNR